MADFLFKMNIAHHEKLLTGETDSKKIVMLHRLAEEEASLPGGELTIPNQTRPNQTPQSKAASVGGLRRLNELAFTAAIHPTLGLPGSKNGPSMGGKLRPSLHRMPAGALASGRPGPSDRQPYRSRQSVLIRPRECPDQAGRRPATGLCVQTAT